MSDLTLRENQVLALVEQGVHHKEIAYRQGVAEQTVKNWVVIIRHKLGVADRDIETRDIRRLRSVAVAAGEAIARE